jgi:hypothetical protein
MDYDNIKQVYVLIYISYDTLDTLSKGGISAPFGGNNCAIQPFNRMSGITKTPIPKITGKNARQITATILALIGIAGSVQLLRDHSISELTFTGLCAGSSLIGLFIAFIDRVTILSLRELKITLRQIEDSKAEVQELAVETAVLVAISLDGVYVSPDRDNIRIAGQIDKILELSDLAPSDPRIQKIRDEGYPIKFQTR